MPKNPTSKRIRKSTRNRPVAEEREPRVSDNEPIDEGFDGEENNAKPVDKEPPKSRKMSKKTQTRSSAKKETVYAVAKKNAKELATSGVNTLKETQERLLEMFDQELQFQKLEEDCRQPLVTHEEIFGNLQEAYTPLCEELLRKRQEKIADVSRMLKNNKPARQEALKDMSKKARHQLEQAKLREKEATDAAELIKRIKILLHN